MTDDPNTQEGTIETPEAPSAPAPTATSQPSLIDILGDVRVTATVVLGTAAMHLGELRAVRPGAVIELDRMVGERADLLANGHLIAHGEVVVVEGAFALRITDIAEAEAPTV